MKRIFSIFVSSVFCFFLIFAFSSCEEKKIDLTEDFYLAYAMENDQLSLQSGFHARLFRVRKENAEHPKIIIDMCAVYDDATGYHKTSYDWNKNDAKKEDLRKIGEYFDIYAENRNLENYSLYIVFHTEGKLYVYDYQTDELTYSTETNSFKITDDGEFVDTRENIF